MVHSLEAQTLSAALDTVDEAIGIYDADDRLIAFNHRYADWRSAIGGAVARGASWDQLVRASVEAGAIPEAVGCEEQWLESRRRARGAYSVIRKLADGRSFKVNERRMADGGIAVVWTDISDLLQAQHERSEAVERDEQNLRAMGQLTIGVAHDFNNLLTALIGNLTLLRRHLQDDDARAFRLLANAMQGAERGATLTQRLLAFTRRKPAPEPQIVDLAALINGLSDLLRSALGASIQVVANVSSDLPAVWVEHGQLELAVLNLAVNARDAMADGGQLIIDAQEAHDVSQASAGVATAYVVLRVTDTGTGMAEATLARATEPLFTTKDVGKGTGLGLAMVHALAVKSGGRLVLRSDVGIGTTAELWLRQLSPPA